MSSSSLPPIGPWSDDGPTGRTSATDAASPFNSTTPTSAVDAFAPAPSATGAATGERGGARAPIGFLFASLAAWAALTMRTDSAALRTVTVVLALACIVLAAAVPYARARAESIGATASVGIAERTDRLVVALVAAFTVGLGAPQWVLSAALGYVALASFATVVQRIVAVRRQVHGRTRLAAGDGEPEEGA